MPTDLYYHLDEAVECGDRFWDPFDAMLSHALSTPFKQISGAATSAELSMTINHNENMLLVACLRSLHRST
jgi:hypothetical protein